MLFLQSISDTGKENGYKNQMEKNLAGVDTVLKKIRTEDFYNQIIVKLRDFYSYENYYFGKDRERDIS